jgi:murein DD-endopeptidase MepM/ murein hydrolase activator NlpD
LYAYTGARLSRQRLTASAFLVVAVVAGGNARGTPPHLHYGIYRFTGGAINPSPLL